MSDATHRLVTEDAELAAACARLARAGAVAVDTEFRRERTYRPELCLVQLAVPGEHLLVDALAIRDWEPLRALFVDPAVEKVLHSARQDLEIFWMLWDQLPRPLFDTQVAAALLGHGESLGYAAIVEELLGVRLAKAHARTDWTRRPLSEQQLAYAADDVVHLVAVHAKLSERLEREGRSAWHHAEAERLLDPGLYRTAPEEAWRSVRGQGRLRGDERRVLRAVAAWRERRAEARDRPRRWILADEAVLALSRRRPQDRAGLEAVDELPERLRARHGDRLLAVIREALATPSEETSARPRRRRLESSEQALVDALADCVRRCAAEQGVAATVLAPRADLEAIALHGDASGATALTGWRRGLVGEALLALREERLGR